MSIFDQFKIPKPSEQMPKTFECCKVAKFGQIWNIEIAGQARHYFMQWSLSSNPAEFELEKDLDKLIIHSFYGTTRIPKVGGSRLDFRPYYTCGQSYKQFTLVNYDSRVVPDLKILQITTLFDFQFSTGQTLALEVKRPLTASDVLSTFHFSIHLQHRKRIPANMVSPARPWSACTPSTLTIRVRIPLNSPHNRDNGLLIGLCNKSPRQFSFKK